MWLNPQQNAVHNRRPVCRKGRIPMKKSWFSVRFLTLSAVIAAVYCALTLLLAPISYGAWQCRVSEAMTMLPLLMPQAIPGLFIGCLLSNLLGPSGGILDIIFGSLATLIAAYGTYQLRNRTWLAAACPVLANGLIVGTVVAYSFNLPLILTMIQVAAGEAVAVLLGLLMIKALRKVDLSKYI